MNFLTSLILVVILFHCGASITTPTKKLIRGSSHSRTYDRCASKIETRLEAMKRRDSPTGRDASLDLSGYALHQKLRSLSYDMYVTGMRVRVPGKVGWFRVEECRYNPSNKSLDTRLVFRDLSVTGQVRLYQELYRGPSSARADLPGEESCNMTLRLRRAGLGITVKPQKTSRGYVDIESEAKFLEPNFVSVYAFGCKLPKIEHRQAVDYEDKNLDKEVPKVKETSDFEQELENVFLRGIKTLLTTYMQKQLEPALRDTLLSNLGYTLSYG